MAEISDQTIQRLAEIARQLAAIVEELTGAGVVLSPDIEARVAERLAGGACLVCGIAKGGKYSRGCCQTCYTDCTRKIKSGQITESALIQSGLLTKDKSKGGRKRIGPDPLSMIVAPGVPPLDMTNKIAAVESIISRVRSKKKEPKK